VSRGLGDVYKRQVQKSTSTISSTTITVAPGSSGVLATTTTTTRRDPVVQPLSPVTAALGAVESRLGRDSVSIDKFATEDAISAVVNDIVVTMSIFSSDGTQVELLKNKVAIVPPRSSVRT
jgi:hypothetical protein